MVVRIGGKCIAEIPRLFINLLWKITCHYAFFWIRSKCINWFGSEFQFLLVLAAAFFRWIIGKFSSINGNYMFIFRWFIIKFGELESLLFWTINKIRVWIINLLLPKLASLTDWLIDRYTDSPTLIASRHRSLFLVRVTLPADTSSQQYSSSRALSLFSSPPSGSGYPSYRWGILPHLGSSNPISR